MKPALFADDPEFWFQTLRALGHTSYGAADIGEVLTTAQRINPGDWEGWHDEWLATADRVSAEAESRLASGHRISARDGLMRASNYYRSAEFFLHGDQEDPRIAHAYARGVGCFRAAAGLFEPAIEPVEIPYEGTVLRGYFYGAPGGEGDDAPRPTMVMHNGLDGPAEEVHCLGASAGQERGYHVLTFDGPGQGGARTLDGLVFRPDWEHVVGPVLDWLLARPEVDEDRVGLLGISFGGLLAPRAAAFEHRLAACVCLDGLYDVGSVVSRLFPWSDDETEAALRAKSAPEADAVIAETMEADPQLRWMFSHGPYVMGGRTPREFLARGLDYTVADGVAERIACPTLVCEAEDDPLYEGQPGQLFEHLTCRKTFMRFSSAEGAGVHCQLGAQRLAFARIYDWLDDVLAPNR